MWDAYELFQYVDCSLFVHRNEAPICFNVLAEVGIRCFNDNLGSRDPVITIVAATQVAATVDIRLRTRFGLYYKALPAAHGVLQFGTFGLGSLLFPIFFPFAPIRMTL